MPSSRTASRASAKARAQVIDQLKEDHKRVRKAYRDFKNLDLEEDGEACEALVTQVLDELTVHATLEEELLYPAARGAIADEDMIDEAEVEHASMRALIDQLRGMSSDEEKYGARFTVLCEYVVHHVKEEESEMFPQLERARLDWESMAAEMEQRRQELMPAENPAEEMAEQASKVMGQEGGDTQRTLPHEGGRVPKEEREGSAERGTQRR